MAQHDFRAPDLPALMLQLHVHGGQLEALQQLHHLRVPDAVGLAPVGAHEVPERARHPQEVALGIAGPQPGPWGP